MTMDCPINWAEDYDCQLLYALDQYVSEFGVFRNDDWVIIAHFAFERPDQENEVRLRYEYLKNELTIETLEDYNNYKHIPNKKGWVNLRKLSFHATAHARYIQRQENKERILKTKRDLESDLILLLPDLTLEGIYSRELWMYLCGARRLSFILYLSLVDALVEKLPFDVYDCEKWSRQYNEFDVVSLVMKWGIPFDRTRDVAPAAGVPFELPNPNQNVGIAEFENEPLARNKYTATYVMELMKRKSNGIYTPAKWILMCKDKEIRKFSSKGPMAFQKEMKRLGISTSRSFEQVTLEFNAYVLPNYWLLGDFFLERKRTEDAVGYPTPSFDVSEALYDGDYRAVTSRGLRWPSQYWQFGGEACVRIYHSLSQVSLKHLRKTVYYLVAIGLLNCQDVPAKYWVDQFLKHLLLVPCGECWLAEPEEFEDVRSRLRLELLSRNGYICQTPGTTYECRKGVFCYWKKQRSMKPREY